MSKGNKNAKQQRGEPKNLQKTSVKLHTLLVEDRSRLKLQTRTAEEGPELQERGISLTTPLTRCRSSLSKCSFYQAMGEKKKVTIPTRRKKVTQHLRGS